MKNFNDWWEEYKNSENCGEDVEFCAEDAWNASREFNHPVRYCILKYERLVWANVGGVPISNCVVEEIRGIFHAWGLDSGSSCAIVEVV